MAGASLLTLLDDISILMDDVGVMTKIATYPLPSTSHKNLYKIRPLKLDL